MQLACDLHALVRLQHVTPDMLKILGNLNTFSGYVR
jgi:hypothetical protein